MGAGGIRERNLACGGGNRLCREVGTSAESELVETYEVARSTARQAVAPLREEGLVYTVAAREPTSRSWTAGPGSSW